MIDPKGTFEAARGHAHRARKSAGRLVISGLGFSVAYFFDPEHGSARRKQAVEVVNHVRRATVHVKSRRQPSDDPDRHRRQGRHCGEWRTVAALARVRSRGARGRCTDIPGGRARRLGAQCRPMSRRRRPPGARAARRRRRRRPPTRERPGVTPRPRSPARPTPSLRRAGSRRGRPQSRSGSCRADIAPLDALRTFARRTQDRFGPGRRDHVRDPMARGERRVGPFEDGDTRAVTGGDGPGDVVESLPERHARVRRPARWCRWPDRPSLWRTRTSSSVMGSSVRTSARHPRCARAWSTSLISTAQTAQRSCVTTRSGIDGAERPFVQRVEVLTGGHAGPDHGIDLRRVRGPRAARSSRRSGSARASSRESRTRRSPRPRRDRRPRANRISVAEGSRDTMRTCAR